jgi:CheY-like chemotaxis protein/HPt (histidine-containing phosphotransfer) domain-containing protein
MDAKQTEPLRILVVEDNAVNQVVLQRQLERVGHQVVRAGNGREALELLDRDRFDVVLMDGQMPEMDGLRATRLLRAREKAVGGHVPVIAVTANALPGERERCLAAGMDDYLAKPVTGAALFAAIAGVLGRGTEEEQAAGTGPGERWLAKLHAQRFDGKAIATLVRTALEEVPERLAFLRQAVEASDAVVVKAAAHSLKGALGIFSPTAASAAACLEEMGARQDLAGAAAGLEALQSEVTPLLASMAKHLEEGAL